MELEQNNEGEIQGEGQEVGMGQITQSLVPHSEDLRFCSGCSEEPLGGFKPERN